MIKSPFDLFADMQETYEEAVQKSADESKSFAKTKHFRMDSPGTYLVRILPLAPVKQEDGTFKLDRKGYEYPIKTQVLKLENPNPTNKKDKVFYVNVCQAAFANISVDLIDTYTQVAEAKYGNNEKLIKKIQSSGFEGGLKWNSQRAMYVLDMNDRKEGIQMLTLSYSQYRDLEDRKLSVWKKLLENTPKHPCPISSIRNAYPVEIVRKEENKKTTYTFNVDILSGMKGLTEEEVNALMEAVRIPNAIYRYSKFHLEATIEFLKQYDNKMDIDIMSSPEIADAIAKIKLELPADDKSHFSFDKKERKGDDADNASEEETIDTLWERWEALKEKGIGDKSDEGQELRDAIRAFIDANELSVRVTRGKTNQDLLEDIEDALGEPDAEDTPEETAQEESKENAPKEDDDDPEDEQPAPEEEEPARPARRRGEYNEDTNEPAAGTTERRSARPARRRR